MSQNRLNGRQTRWLIKLLPYDFHLFYRKEALNPADGPSRRPDYFDTGEADDSSAASIAKQGEEHRAISGYKGTGAGRTRKGNSDTELKSPIG